MRSVSVRLDDLKTMILNIGFVGENEHKRFIFDCKKMFDQYPHAAASMTVQPPEGEAYPAIIERDGDYVIWDVTNSDLAHDGDGELQLAFTQEPHIAKSHKGRTRVCPALVPSGEIPEGIDDFLTRAGAALTAIPETIDTALEEAKESGEFDGPAGPKGDKGDPGERGPAGPKGDPGDPGDVIDDTAGTGDTDKAWSANKLTNEFDLKAPKANPEFTGSISMGRMDETTVGNGSVAIGTGTEASAMSAFAEGVNTKATGLAGHAEGVATVASGLFSHAENNGTVASGVASHADGNLTISNHKAQHVFGELNIADDSSETGDKRGNYVEIVGNGDIYSAIRSNARTLDWDGNEELAGDLKIFAGTNNEVSVSNIKNAINGKQDAPETAGTAGQVLGLDSNLDPVWVNQQGGGGGAVNDVQINGTSIVSSGVANIPMANATGAGVLILGDGFSTNSQTNKTNVDYASADNIKAGASQKKSINPYAQHRSVFYGLSKAAGVDMSSSSNTVGNYTEDAKSSISQMLDAPETISGTTPSITAKAGVRYICGECSTLTIVVPSSGCIDVTFESGSTPTVLTVTPPTGMTMKWANGFDPSSLDANTTYEINIMDGCLGVAGSWT